jgi:hypothetical protein
MESSQFRIVDLGIVAENKALSSKNILVTPLESLPYLQGEIRHAPELVSVEGVDSDGVAYTDKVVTDLTVEALWLPHGNTNRRTAPDVRRGERVVLWQSGNSDQYYWSSMGRDDNLRKLETVVYTFSGTQDEGVDSTDPDQCYYIEISTHNKQITLQTSDKNGEPFRYTFQFNTGEGVVTLMDDVGNYFEFDSSETKLTLKNKDGTWVSLDRKDILGYAPKNIDLKAESRIKLTCGSSELTLLPSETILQTPKFSGKR